jgi:hypothetical protein
MRRPYPAVPPDGDAGPWTDGDTVDTVDVADTVDTVDTADVVDDLAGPAPARTTA